MFKSTLGLGGGWRIPPFRMPPERQRHTTSPPTDSSEEVPGVIDAVRQLLAVGAGARRPCQEGRSGSAQRGGGEDTQRAGASQDDYEVRQQHASAEGLSLTPCQGYPSLKVK